jgi:hypothetical protein
MRTNHSLESDEQIENTDDGTDDNSLDSFSETVPLPKTDPTQDTLPSFVKEPNHNPNQPGENKVVLDAADENEVSSREFIRENRVSPTDLFGSVITPNELPNYDGQFRITAGNEEKARRLTNVFYSMEENKTISRSDAQLIDSIHNGFINEDRPEGYFTIEPTKTQYQETIDWVTNTFKNLQETINIQLKEHQDKLYFLIDAIRVGIDSVTLSNTQNNNKYNLPQLINLFIKQFDKDHRVFYKVDILKLYEDSLLIKSKYSNDETIGNLILGRFLTTDYTEYINLFSIKTPVDLELFVNEKDYILNILLKLKQCGLEPIEIIKTQLDLIKNSVKTLDTNETNMSANFSHKTQSEIKEYRALTLENCYTKLIIVHTFIIQYSYYLNNLPIHQ